MSGVANENVEKLKCFLYIIHHSKKQVVMEHSLTSWGASVEGKTLGSFTMKYLTLSADRFPLFLIFSTTL